MSLLECTCELYFTSIPNVQNDQLDYDGFWRLFRVFPILSRLKINPAIMVYLLNCDGVYVICQLIVVGLSWTDPFSASFSPKMKKPNLTMPCNIFNNGQSQCFSSGAKSKSSYVSR